MHTTPLALSLILTLAPGLVAAQTLVDRSPREIRPTRFTLEATAGSTARGGDVESASVGFSPLPWLTLLVQGERFHNPTRVEYFPNGSSISRGFTTHVVAGEVRVGTPASGRVSPYAALGMGTGTWGSNVDRFYPERDTGPVGTVYAGGGVRVRLGSNLRVVADARVALAVSGDSLLAYVPIRAGLAWDF